MKAQENSKQKPCTCFECSKNHVIEFGIVYFLRPQRAQYPPDRVPVFWPQSLHVLKVGKQIGQSHILLFGLL